MCNPHITAALNVIIQKLTAVLARKAVEEVQDALEEVADNLESVIEELEVDQDLDRTLDALQSDEWNGDETMAETDDMDCKEDVNQQEQKEEKAYLVTRSSRTPQKASNPLIRISPSTIKYLTTPHLERSDLL